MGVSGTLETLNQTEREIIRQNYKISKQTIIPSVFSKNNLIFNENDIQIENQDDYYNNLRKEISDKINPNPELGIYRAVLVFFESKEKLMDFYQSKQFKELQIDTKCLTEEALIQEKESIIKSATTPGQITLLTRSFGRGTDFIVRDKVINNNGGVHVIQTFLSEELSEEVQIQGRTARQGKKGSYSLILLDKELEKFQITIQEINDQKGQYKQFLSQKRLLNQIDQQKNMAEYFNNASHQHLKAEQFLKNLYEQNISEIKNYLYSINKGPQIEIQQTRILFLIDGTASMNQFLNKTAITIEEMYKRAKYILEQESYDPESFLLKIAIYRNYGQKEDDILMASGWEQNPVKLKDFLQSIKAYGGDKPGEAVEVGFQYALLELEQLAQKNQSIDQIILIGDAPSNTPNETINKRKKCYQEEYWTLTKFKNPGNIDQLVDQIQQKSIIVNTFYLNKKAQQSFENIAKIGQGKALYLDINVYNAADTLTELITVEILRKIGNKEGSIEKGEKLVNAYKTIYQVRMTFNDNN